mmetsp:Transcript_1581/g.1090  ORF Transcript_1581/g.1090 Transcript_1581/m.1090 type:complete len:83 (+) Transcript_1581:352-600(+)|eukprot:CAMPEP_0201282486 /NCGR_PEP_ID=MMETSP1317-20130820/5773_1 /ASSEMBLY_ACC=CAM_ASM_000770 /TAXON_ID=187299 /ORGANISM="Undescribed Undescribed, Strain Undescribed" /LENGTH=82 /DNA_ID=CAMNT_0047595291 /DNA_START=139 /DNA_END=387 /DNA_ORIENTATION=-
MQKVLALREEGPTALGPAMLVSIELAAQGKPGSKVIICTDGIANVGLGSLEEAAEEGEQFYEQCAQLAAGKGLEVNIISIEG